MKKVIMMILAVVMMITVSGCATKGDEFDSHEKYRIDDRYYVYMDEAETEGYWFIELTNIKDENDKITFGGFNEITVDDDGNAVKVGIVGGDSVYIDEL